MSEQIALDYAEHTRRLLDNADERVRRPPGTARGRGTDRGTGVPGGARFADFLEPDDRDAWTALLDPDRPEWLGRRDDLHHMEVLSVHIGGMSS